jgi:hypothetical protein
MYVIVFLNILQSIRFFVSRKCRDREVSLFYFFIFLSWIVKGYRAGSADQWSVKSDDYSSEGGVISQHLGSNEG